MHRFLKGYLWIVGTVAVTTLGATFFVSAGTTSSLAPTRASVAGNYPCWSYNVGTVAGGRCTNPPLVLKKNGTYSMSSERGNFTLKANKITLSKSKFRGAGTLSGDGMQVTFSYKYNGQVQTVTYLRDTLPERPGMPILFLDLTIVYPAPKGWLSWASTVELEANDGKAPKLFTGLARTADNQHVNATFKKGVYGGRAYTAYISTGTDRVSVGTVDLTNVRKAGTLKKSITTPATPPLSSREESPAPGSPSAVPGALTPVSDSGTAANSQTMSPPVPAVRCNPDLPHYQQPNCVE